MKTILGIGAHYDDCVFGISGLLLKALRKRHRVVVLCVIGDYGTGSPSRRRGARQRTVGTGQGVRRLDAVSQFAEMKFDVTEAATRLVAEQVADIAPDVALTLWPHDQHPDHERASGLSEVALGFGDRLIDPGKPYKRPSRVYQFDNGPRHTIGFEPNTFVDVTDEWPLAMEWLGKLMALMRNQPFDKTAALDGAQRAKEALALYRGQTCGVKYAEAVRGVNAYPLDIF